jgi:hypothetical protein
MSSTVAKDRGAGNDRTVSDESILKIAKEIAVKFIEVGRITPASFERDFKDIHTTIEAAVRKEEQ